MDTVKRHRKQLWIIGIDEVGRGPLAGPITVAAVAAPVSSNFQFSISNEFSITQFPIFKTIKDSKKLSPNQRNVWNKTIRQNFLYSIQSISSGIIDRKGITYAARVAVSDCIKKILPKLKIVNCKLKILLDGNLYAPPEYKNQRTIIRGDKTEPLIAAASIVAKVHRDRYMARLHKKYPHYGFDRNKGYGTAYHMESIAKYGLSPVHRQSFCR